MTTAAAAHASSFTKSRLRLLKRSKPPKLSLATMAHASSLVRSLAAALSEPFKFSIATAAFAFKFPLCSSYETDTLVHAPQIISVSLAIA